MNKRKKLSSWVLDFLEKNQKTNGLMQEET
jgi:hypothetical protein